MQRKRESSGAHSCTHTTVFAIILRRRSHPVKVVEVLQCRFLLHTSMCVRMYAHRHTGTQTQTHRHGHRHTHIHTHTHTHTHTPHRRQNYRGFPSSFPTCMYVSMHECVCTITSVNMNVHMRGCKEVTMRACMYKDPYSYAPTYTLSQIYSLGARGVSSQHACACVHLYTH